MDQSNKLQFISMDTVAMAVNAIMNVSIDMICIKSRQTGKILDAKFIFAHICRGAGFSDRDIGKFCNAEGSTIYHRVTRCGELLEIDKRFSRTYTAIMEVIGNKKSISAIKELEEEIERTQEHLIRLESIRDKLI